jgi:lysophospholipase L1-like esterase
VFLAGAAAESISQPKRLRIPVGRYNKVVGFGDSFTAGLGASDQAHSYPALLASKLQAEYKCVAENGWSSTQILLGLPSQIDQVPTDTDLLIGTAGGNAVGVRKLGIACITKGCGLGSEAFENAAEIFNSDPYYAVLRANDEALLRQAPNADIGKPGYPKIVTPYRLPPRIERLWVDSGLPKLTALGEANDEGLASLIDMLNTATQKTVEAIGDPRLFYIPPPPHIDIVSTRLLGLPDHFHVDLRENSPNAGHPNNYGHQAMARADPEALALRYNGENRENGALFAGKAARR